jgi:hypothetical protein
MARMKKATAKKAAPKKTVKRTPSKRQAPKEELAPVPTQQNPQPPMGTPPMGANGPMMRKGGKIKKAQGGTKFAALAPPFDKATYADKIAGATKNKAKSGTKMKMGGTIKKAQGGTLETPPSRIQSTNQKVQSNVNKIAMKNAGNSRVGTAKSGKSMKTCKGGC